MPEHISKDTRELGALIDQGVQLLTRLQTLLDTELAALESRNVEQLQQNNQLKQECLQALEYNIRDRNARLARLGVETSRQAVIDFIHTLPSSASASLKQRWQQLETSLDQVRALNLRNEQTLLRSKQNTDQLLALLRGHVRDNTTIYDQKGDKGRYEGQRSLGKA